MRSRRCLAIPPVVLQALGASKVEYDELAAERRAAFLRRVPPEPAEGAAGSSKLCVHVGGDSHWRCACSPGLLVACVCWLLSYALLSCGRWFLRAHPPPPPPCRRFDADCTLEDVINFVRSLPGTPAVDAIGDLRIADVTTRPARRFDASTQLGLTLKTLGLWPSGQVRCRVEGQDEAYEEAMLGLVRLPSEHRS